MLNNKNIVIGVSGSIAAYKIATLVRLLVKQKANVKVIMTEAAKTFITPLTLATLSKNPVLSSFSADNDTGQWNNHVELGLWADLLLIAPASANTLAKCAHGICDSLLVATYLSARCQVLFAPAMDLDMYQHFSTKNNLQLLSDNGNNIIAPNVGDLASGLEGKGRMAEPEELLYYISAHFSKIEALKGKKVLVSAGPTQEDIDPVRYISNHSSGKMGYAIARSFALAGAEVVLVAGPTALAAPQGVQVENVRSAQEMLDAMRIYHAAADVVIFAAAVADYRPTDVADQKLKKNDAALCLALEQTEDIAALLGKYKKQNQVHIGFALETNDALENAKGKLNRKNFDMIVLNSLQDSGAGFRYDTNKITLIDKKGKVQNYELKAKDMVAEDIKHAILAYINQTTI